MRVGESNPGLLLPTTYNVYMYSNIHVHVVNSIQQVHTHTVREMEGLMQKCMYMCACIYTCTRQSGIPIPASINHTCQNCGACYNCVYTDIHVHIHDKIMVGPDKPAISGQHTAYMYRLLYIHPKKSWRVHIYVTSQ